MNAYLLTLFAHSYLRWIVLMAAVWMVGLTGSALLKKRDWAPIHHRSQRLLLRAADLQFTLGVILYLFLSPYSRAFFADPSINHVTLRFFGLRHPLGMLLAVSCVHIGWLRGKKAKTGSLRLRRAFTWSLAALASLLASVPWPFLEYGRPLLRGLIG